MTDFNDSFEQRLKDPVVRLVFEQEWLHQEFVSQLEAQMERTGLSRTGLAKRLGKSLASVSRALRSGQNLTMHSMVEMAQAAGLRVCLNLVPLVNMEMPRSISSLPWTVMCFREIPANNQFTISAEAGDAIEIAQEEAGTKKADDWCSKPELEAQAA